jgi:hypothetical protein
MSLIIGIILLTLSFVLNMAVIFYAGKELLKQFTQIKFNNFVFINDEKAA